MSVINKYEIYCNTEETYIIGWGETPPTKCYNNASHDVNIHSVQLLDTVASNTVSIKEDMVDVTGNKWVECIPILDVAPTETKSVTYTFPITVSMYSFMFVTDATNKGDNLSIIANPNTDVGLISNDIAVGATTLTLPALVISQIVPGFWLVIDDGTNIDDIGRVLAVNRLTNTITFQTPTTHAFSATNTHVKFSIKVLNNLRLCGADKYRFFDDIIGSTPIPTGTTATFIYTNNSTTGENKELSIYITCVF